MPLLRAILLSTALLLSSCGPSLEERVAQARTPEELFEVGEDVLASIDDQQSLDQGKRYIVTLYHLYKSLDQKSQQQLHKRFLRENKEIHREVDRILQLDLTVGTFDDAHIDQHVHSTLRLLKQMNQPIRLK